MIIRQCAPPAAKRFTPLAVLLLALATPAGAHRIEKRFSVELRPIVTVRNAQGKIFVKSWARLEVLVAADHLSEKTEVDAEQVGNRVDVITHHLSEDISEKELEANYEITVPEETELQVKTDSGWVVIERVNGEMTIDTVSAKVDLKEVSGYLVIKTVGGSLVCFRCAGHIDFNSISGSVTFTQPVSHHVRAQTASGGVFFDGDFLRGGIYILKTYSGPIQVRFSDSDSFDLSATTTGQVDSQVKLKPPSHNRRSPASRFSNSLFGTFNDGLARVELISFNGKISILRRE